METFELKFTVENVAPGDTVYLTQNTEHSFIPYRIVVDDAFVMDFGLIDVKVDEKPRIPPTPPGGLPMFLFTADALGSVLTGEPIAAGQTVCLVVRNNSNKKANFEAVMLGRLLENA